MKKFEDELQKAFNEMPMFASFEKSRAVFMRHFKDWVSPEDHQAEITKLKNEIDSMAAESYEQIEVVE